MFNVSNKFVPNNILNLFKKIPDIHIYSTQAVIVHKPLKIIQIIQILKYKGIIFLIIIICYLSVSSSNCSYIQNDLWCVVVLHGGLRQSW